MDTKGSRESGELRPGSPRRRRSDVDDGDKLIDDVPDETAVTAAAGIVTAAALEANMVADVVETPLVIDVADGPVFPFVTVVVGVVIVVAVVVVVGFIKAALEYDTEHGRAVALMTWAESRCDRRADDDERDDAILLIAEDEGRRELMVMLVRHETRPVTQASPRRAPVLIARNDDQINKASLKQQMV